MNTFGRAAKCALTFALVGPLFLCLLALAHAGKQPVFTVFVVPGGCFAMLSYALLPEIWEKGRR